MKGHEHLNVRSNTHAQQVLNNILYECIKILIMFTSHIRIPVYTYKLIYKCFLSLSLSLYIYIYIYIYIYMSVCLSLSHTHTHTHISLYICIYHYVALLTRVYLTFSLAFCPYHLSFPAGPLDYILCPYSVVVGKFLLVGQN